MATTALKRYSSPELYLLNFTEQDVITSSAEENLGGLPKNWYGNE